MSLCVELFSVFWLGMDKKCYESAYKKDGDTLFSRVCAMEQVVIVLKEKRGDSDCI